MYPIELAPRYPGLFKKNGSATIVDYDILDGIIDQLPLAEITPTKHDEISFNPASGAPSAGIKRTCFRRTTGGASNPPKLPKLSQLPDLGMDTSSGRQTEKESRIGMPRLRLGGGSPRFDDFEMNGPPAGEPVGWARSKGRASGRADRTRVEFAPWHPRASTEQLLAQVDLVLAEYVDHLPLNLPADFLPACWSP